MTLLLLRGLRTCSAILLFWPVMVLYAEDGPRTPGELVLGAVAMDTPAVMHQRLRPLSGYLSDALNRPVRLRLSSDYSSGIDDLVAGRVDIAYLTPVAYIRAHQAANVRLLVEGVARGRKSFRLMVVTRQDSTIRSVQDLAGRRFALGDEMAYLQRAVLAHAGMPLDRLGSHKFLGHFDNIARGVANGDFDAGILRDPIASEWQHRGLKIVYTSPALSPYNIAVRPGMDLSMGDALRAALLQLDVNNPAHVRVLHALDADYDGFAPARDADYDVVRMLVRPFESGS